MINKVESLSNQIKNILGFVTAIIAFLTSIAQFVELWRGSQHTVNLVILSVSTGFLWFFLLFIYRKTKVEIGILGLQNKTPYYSKEARSISLFGIIAIPFSLIAVLTYRPDSTVDWPDSAQIKILLATFEHEEKADNLFTIRIQEALEENIQEDIAFRSTDEVISVLRDGKERARELGREHNADLVIWGYYLTAGEVVAYIELLNDSDVVYYLNTIDGRAKQNYRIRNTEDSDNTIDIRYQMGEELTFVSLFIAGITFLRSGDYKKSLDYLTKATELKSEPSDIVTPGLDYFYQGHVLVLLEEYKKAIDAFTNAIKIDSSFVTAHYRRGRLYASLENFREAEDDLTNAIILSDSSFHDHFYERGYLFNTLGRYEDAISDFNTYIAIFDTSNSFLIGAKYDNYYQRGDAWHHLNQFEKAIDDYTETLGFYRSLFLDSTDNSNDYLYSLTNRGIAYLRLEQYEEAISDLSEVIQLDSFFSDYTYYFRGKSFVGLEEYNEAISDFSKVIELDSTLTGPAYSERSIIYRKIGEIDKATQDSLQAKSILSSK